MGDGWDSLTSDHKFKMVDVGRLDVNKHPIVVAVDVSHQVWRRGAWRPGYAMGNSWE
jgi:hypothetical protein